MRKVTRVKYFAYFLGMAVLPVASMMATQAVAQSTTPLGPIDVYGNTINEQSNQNSEEEELKYTSGGVSLGTTKADTGTTIYGADNAKARAHGGGDANTIMRNSPNVQYQNEQQVSTRETDNDGGTNPYREIDTQPLQFSISGGKVYQNNIILNGIGINNIVNPVEDSDARLDDDPFPVNDVIYGVHPQTIYVPAEFLDKATIIDSNASAKYGQFLGGVVQYDLASPPTDRWRATLDYDRHSDEMVNYKLGTEDGTNPLDRQSPDFTKNNVAVSLGGPISPMLSVIGQYSGKFAETKQQKRYEFLDELVGMESENHFFRFAASVKTDIGSFKFDNSFTDYTKSWQSEASRDLFIDVENTGQTSQLEYKNKLPGLDYTALGIADVSLTSRAFYNESKSSNTSNGNESRSWVRMERRNPDRDGNWTTIFDGEHVADWCRPLPEEALSDSSRQNNTICREGGWGSMFTTQEDIGLQSEMTGKLMLGTFLLGGEAKRVEGTRERSEAFTNYASWNTLADSPTVSEFNCPDGHPACISEQYARIWTELPEFDIAAGVSTYNLYSEIDQTFGWVNVRAGLRFDYETYFKNPNLAPRLVGTLSPFGDWVSVSAGFNRYYQDASLVYAIRDKAPRSITHKISGHDAGGNVSDDVNSRVNTGFTYRSSGLDTPYKNEYAYSIRLKEPLFNGHFRIRHLKRYGKDEFSRVDCEETSSSLCNTLSNDGSSTYNSWTGEYTAAWKSPNPTFFSSLGISTNITWSEQTANRGTFFDGDGSEDYILYNGERYTSETFVAVTGNLDIPVRIGALLSTSWLDNKLSLDLNANLNLGYEGVYDTGDNETVDGLRYDVYVDKTFDPTLNLDLAGQYDFTKNVAVTFKVNNLTDTVGNKIANNSNPWIRGRSFWLGTKLNW